MMNKPHIILYICLLVFTVTCTAANVTYLEGIIKHDTRLTLKGSETILYINSPGGSLMGALEIIEQIERYKLSGTLSCLVRGKAASGAALILLTCNKVYVDDFSVVMFHTPRYTTEKDPKKIHICSDTSTDNLCKVIYNQYIKLVERYKLSSILSSVEYTFFKSGLDIRLTGEDYINRLESKQ